MNNIMRSYVLGLLSRREYSRVELIKKLILKGLEKKTIELILQDLENKGLQSDLRFAENYVNMRRRRGYGPMRILIELKKRGIDKNIAVMCVNPSSSSWLKLAIITKNKKFGTEYPQDQIQYAKQVRYLHYKGFTNIHINTVLDHEEN